MTYIVIAQDHTGRYVQTPGRHYHSHAEATAYAETVDAYRDPRVIEVDLSVGRGPVLRRAEGADTGSLAAGVRPPLRCVDGTVLSVQASAGHHCTPRNDKGPYTHVEVQFLGRLPPAHWHVWAAEDAGPPGNIFTQVPVAEVIGFLNDHGGLMEGELPPLSMGGQGW